MHDAAAEKLRVDQRIAQIQQELDGRDARAAAAGLDDLIRAATEKRDALLAAAVATAVVPAAVAPTPRPAAGSGHEFTDADGRPWRVAIRLSMLPELKAIGLDLGAFSDQTKGQDLAGGLAAAMFDLEKFGQILGVVLGGQIEARGLDERAFAQGFDADALAAATDAVLFAAIDIVYRQADIRATMRGEVAKVWAQTAAAVRTATSAAPTGCVG